MPCFILYDMRQEKDACTETQIINVTNILKPVWLETVNNESMSQTILCKGKNVYANSCWPCSRSLRRRISCQIASSQMHTRAADINMHICSLACHSSSLSALPKLSLYCVHGCIRSCPQLSPCTFLDCLFYATAGRPLTYHPCMI